MAAHCCGGWGWRRAIEFQSRRMRAGVLTLACRSFEDVEIADISLEDYIAVKVSSMHFRSFVFTPELEPLDAELNRWLSRAAQVRDVPAAHRRALPNKAISQSDGAPRSCTVYDILC